MDSIMMDRGSKRRKRMRMTVQGAKLKRWLGEGWIVEGCGVHLVQHKREWIAYEKAGSDKELGRGRTLAEAIENATTVWVCDACGEDCTGADDKRGTYHVLCPAATGDAKKRGQWTLFASPNVYGDVIRPGYRVIDDFLGPGTVVSFIDSSKIAAMVRFDFDPPYRYNMGENPTMAFTNDLQRHVWAENEDNEDFPFYAVNRRKGQAHDC